MLNEQSRKYFNHAFASSGLALNAWHKGNHVKLVEECSKSNRINQMVEFLKTVNSQTLLNCNETVIWAPVIESPQARGTFFTQKTFFTPDEIYKSNRTLAMHTMFSFNSQVKQ